MGDEDEGDADLALDLLELDLHLLAQFQVECAEGLIEEQHLRAVHERPRERDPLTLAAGERRGRPVAEILKTDVGQGLARPLGSLGLRDLLHAQAVLDVLEHAHVREEGVILKDGVDVAGVRRHAGDIGAGELDRACVGAFEAGDHAQDGCLARAGWAEQREELAVVDVQVDIVYRNDVTELPAKSTQADGHRSLRQGESDLSSTNSEMANPSGSQAYSP